MDWVNPRKVSTVFTKLCAVETWDARFRWRSQDQLHDLTVDDTWVRVSTWLTSHVGENAMLWMHRFVQAFGAWKVLPDPNLLLLAGTDLSVGTDVLLVAAVNIAAHLHQTTGKQWEIDIDAIRQSAGVAVRVLANARRRLGAGSAGAMPIGLLGVADALNHMNTPYPSSAAALQVQRLGREVLHGALLASMEVGKEQGELVSVDPARLEQWRQAGIPGTCLHDVADVGLNALPLISLRPQPHLARLANDVSSALDPLEASGVSEVPNLSTIECLLAQLRLHAALHGMTSPNESPVLLVESTPSADDWRECTATAQSLGLLTPEWRLRAGPDA